MKLIQTLLAGLSLLVLSSVANAHIVAVGYTAENNGDVNIFAATYHMPQELAAGCLDIAGGCHAWDGSVAYGSVNTADFGDYVAATNYSGNPVRWLTVTVSDLIDGIYAINITGANAVDYLWPNFSPSLDIDVVETEVSAPSSLMILGLGLIALAYRRRNA